MAGRVLLERLVLEGSAQDRPQEILDDRIISAHRDAKLSRKRLAKAGCAIQTPHSTALPVVSSPYKAKISDEKGTLIPEHLSEHQAN